MALLKKSGIIVPCSPAMAFSLIGFAAVLSIYFQTKVLEKFKHDSVSFNMFPYEENHNNKIIPSDDGPVKEEHLSSSILARRQNLIEFDTTHKTHYHDQSPKCMEEVMPQLLNTWRDAKESICEHEDTSIDKYTLQTWEYHPTLHMYRNIVLNSIRSEVDTANLNSTACQELNKRSQYVALGSSSTSPRPTVIRIRPFDVNNSYERFHAYLNVAMTMALFNISNPQLVYITDRYEDVPSGDLEMWQSFSTMDMIVLPPEGSEVDLNDTSITTNKISIQLMIDMYSSGTSMLVTKVTGGALRGRGTDHHCKSEIFRGITRWMASNLLAVDSASRNDEIQKATDSNSTIQVVWSSRSPYCCRPKDQIYTPSRSIENEDDLVRQLQDKLGRQYNITIVDFGSKSTVESVQIASTSHIIAGVHGAGLIWTSFLPRHGGVVELFGGDRGSVNRHYHNIASLADIHYRSLSIGRGSTSKTLGWDGRTVETIFQKIRSIGVVSEAEPVANEPS
jgi:hypothetical protein